MLKTEQIVTRNLGTVEIKVSGYIIQDSDQRLGTGSYRVFGYIIQDSGQRLGTGSYRASGYGPQNLGQRLGTGSYRVSGYGPQNLGQQLGTGFCRIIWKITGVFIPQLENMKKIHLIQVYDYLDLMFHESPTGLRVGIRLGVRSSYFRKNFL